MHLPVAYDHARFWNKFLISAAIAGDGLDAIVDEEHLSLAVHFLLNRAANEIFVKGRDHGLNREPVFGRRFDDAQIADARRATCAACAEWASPTW